MKIKRVYQKPKSSIFLLGPRGTGKSTFIKNEAEPDLSIDLLKQSIFRPLSLNPSHLEDMVAHLKPGQTVLIDEIQKIPELLNEVHHLIEDRKLIFYLTGSSARKLKTKGVNLLAGRALAKRMFPFCLKEIDGIKSLSKLLMTGCLPKAVTENDDELIEDFLFSYVDTYLKEEVFQEGLTRNLNDFTKFIELAGQYHGQILNFEKSGRELGKSGDTIKSWFQILEDTLIGRMIEAYPLHIFPNESKHPRFYYFDCGIARAAEGIRSLDEVPERKGFYFESIILNEISTYLEVARKRFKIYYYNVSNVGDVDFIIEVKKKALSSPAKLICVEIKLSKTWKKDFNKMLSEVQKRKPKEIIKTIGVYTGTQRLSQSGIEIFPLQQFVDSLWQEKLF